MILPKLEVLKERFEHPTGFGGTMFTTQYSNSGYIIYLNEEGDERYVNVVKKDTAYPTILRDGINVGSTGTLSPTETETHIQRLILATDTYNQIFELFGEDIRIH
ncbi:hypothetical protein ABD91_26000 [Lysinibacillus sphaericus]|nr:hypothetical protein [Lysinibacillus sphaericus]